jgi:hypothetical protein
MTMIDDPANKLTADGRARAAYDLVVMLAGDDNISTQAFSMYVSRLRLEAPEALAACAQRLLTSGTFFLTAGTNAVHTTMPRLSEVIRLHLATDLGLQRPVDLLKLETAIESLIQSRLLAHRATLLCDGLAAMSEAELVLRRQAAECQRVFIRLLDELETVSRGTGRAAFRATLADKAVARPVITELGPSVRGLHRGGRRKDEATQKA